MSLIPRFFLDSVVAIGIVNTRIEEGISWIGTGFLIGKKFGSDGQGRDTYRTYLVTNKHVLKNETEIILRFNLSTQGSAKDLKITLIKENKIPVWYGHRLPEIDVALIPINANLLKENHLNFGFFALEKHASGIEKMRDSGISEGDFVYTLGFPMGLVHKDSQHVIVRHGTISRINDLFEKRSTHFIIDAPVFPGNSGGPVVIKPEGLCIDGTSPHMNAELIGMVKGYLAYRDIAVSQQTQEPRIVFTENSGLSEIIPIDYIRQTIDDFQDDKNANP